MRALPLPICCLFLAGVACSSPAPSSTSTNGGSATTAGGTGTGTATNGTGSGSTCSGCSALGQVCGANGQCQACSADSQCAASNAASPACQLANTDAGNYGTCVACTATVSCAAGSVCDVAGVAEPGKLAQSRGPNVCYADCRNGGAGSCTPGASFCDATSGLCLFGCASTANNCADAGEVCDTDAGRCVGCLSASDCPIDLPGCLANQCGNCAHDSDCPNGQTCDVNNQACICHSSSQCGPLAPDCVSKAFNVPDAGPELRCGCQPDAGSCQGGTKCQPGLGPYGAGECAQSCIDGGITCAPNTYCDIVSGLCGPCTSDVACDANPGGFICLTDGGNAGTCACKVGAAGSCPRGLVCNPPLGCTAACTQPDAGCSGNRICDTATGACRACLQNSDCKSNPQGQVCDNGDGGAYTCTCNQASDCPDGGSCSSSLHLCGLCAVPTDCPISAPGCSSLTFTCGSCVVDGDCPTASPHCSDAGACS